MVRQLLMELNLKTSCIRQSVYFEQLECTIERSFTVLTHKFSKSVGGSKGLGPMSFNVVGAIITNGLTMSRIGSLDLCGPSKFFFTVDYHLREQSGINPLSFRLQTCTQVKVCRGSRKREKRRVYMRRIKRWLCSIWIKF